MDDLIERLRALARNDDFGVGDEAADEIEALRAQIKNTERTLKETRAERDRWYKSQREWEEREAGCCPEDTPFEEVIKALRARMEALEQILETTRKDRNQAEAKWDLLTEQLSKAQATIRELRGEE